MKKRELNLLIVEDQQVFAEGLRYLLLTNDIINEVDFATNFEDCFDKLKWKKHDIVLLDINFDKQYDGIDIAKKIKAMYPGIKILILTQIVKIEHYNVLMNEIKVDGYLDKKMGKEEIFLAINTVLNDAVYLDKRIESMLEIKEWMQLSNMEIDIIQLLGKGFLQKDIANEICRTEKTVQYHLGKLFAKTNSSNAVELVRKYSNYKSANREQNEWK